MKKIIIPIGICASLILTSCDVLNDVAEVLVDGTETTDTKPSLTNGEVIQGLKEALNVGIKNSVDLTSVTDGFLGNADIRLPFPEDALRVKEITQRRPYFSNWAVVPTELNKQFRWPLPKLSVTMDRKQMLVQP